MTVSLEDSRRDHSGAVVVHVKCIEIRTSWKGVLNSGDKCKFNPWHLAEDKSKVI